MYSILSNESLLNYLFIRPWIKWGRPSWNKYKASLDNMQRSRTITPLFFSELFPLGIFSMTIVSVQKLWLLKKFAKCLNKYEATSDGMQRIRAIRDIPEDHNPLRERDIRFNRK